MTVLYNSIGRGYDGTRRADPAIVETLFDLLSPNPDGRYADIACGTGNYTVQLSRSGGSWSGADISELMLAEARLKSEAVDWFCADVESLPWEDGVFDGAVCTLATHHFRDLPVAFTEIGRVLRHGAPLVLFTTTPEQTSAYWLREYFPDMIERSAAQLTDPDTMADALRQGGFVMTATEPFFVPEDLQDHFLYSGKHQPELYLSERFRRGISSFARLIEEEELERGLATLRRDIESGRIATVTERSRNDIGDYLFVRARKEGL